MAGDAKNYLSISMKAGVDLSSRQYCIVTDVTAKPNYVQYAATSTSWPIGILQNKPASSGEAAEVAIAGAPLIKIRGKCTSGTLIVANASGFGVSCATTCGIPIGRLLYGASTNDVVPIVLNATSPVGPRLDTK